MAQIKLQIGDEMKPLSAEDEAKRAYFFCRELESRSHSYLKAVCSDYELRPSKEEIDELIKLMSWTLVYLTAIYCGGVEAQGWLLDFISRALRICDEYTADDDTKKFLKVLGGLEESSIIQKVAMRIATKLKVREESFDGRTRAFLDQTASDALDLLTTALVLPIDTLRDLVQLINTRD